MSSFTNALICEKIKGRLWRVNRSFTYHVGSEESKETIKVPEGFVTDLASIPRLFWRLMPPDDDYTQAAVLHDWICHNHGDVERYYSWRRATEIFEEAMEVLEVPRWRRALMFRAVLMFARRWK